MALAVPQPGARPTAGCAVLCGGQGPGDGSVVRHGFVPVPSRENKKPSNPPRVGFKAAGRTRKTFKAGYLL